MKKDRFVGSYFDSMVTAHARFSASEKVKAAFRGSLPGWARRLLREYNEFVLRQTWNSFARCRSVLDIGCGRGDFLRARPRGMEATGVDIIEAEVAALRSEGLHVVQGDLLELPFEDNSFDGVYISHVVEHLDRNELRRALDEIRRVLRDGGIAVVRTPDFAKSYKDFYSDYTHVRPLTKKGLYRLLSDNGFRSVVVESGLHENSITRMFSFSKPIRFFLAKRLGSFFISDIVGIAEKR